MVQVSRLNIDPPPPLSLPKIPSFLNDVILTLTTSFFPLFEFFILDLIFRKG